jgi:hypothetical protein
MVEFLWVVKLILLRLLVIILYERKAWYWLTMPHVLYVQVRFQGPTPYVSVMVCTLLANVSTYRALEASALVVKLE